jgi:tetratricopeptide (TPR) repeat protein
MKNIKKAAWISAGIVVVLLVILLLVPAMLGRPFLAEYAQEHGKYTLAEKLYKQEVFFLKHFELTRNKPNYIKHIERFADFYMEQGMLEHALELNIFALRVYEMQAKQANSTYHLLAAQLNCVTSYLRIAKIQERKKQYQEAEESYEDTLRLIQTIEKLSTTPVGANRNFFELYSQMSMLKIKEGDLKKANLYLDKMRYYAEFLKKKPPIFYFNISGLDAKINEVQFYLYKAEKKYSQAEKALGTALVVQSFIFVPKNKQDEFLKDYISHQADLLTQAVEMYTLWQKDDMANKLTFKSHRLLYSVNVINHPKNVCANFSGLDKSDFEIKFADKTSIPLPPNHIKEFWRNANKMLGMKSYKNDKNKLRELCNTINE